MKSFVFFGKLLVTSIKIKIPVVPFLGAYLIKLKELFTCTKLFIALLLSMAKMKLQQKKVKMYVYRNG